MSRAASAAARPLVPAAPGGELLLAGLPVALELSGADEAWPELALHALPAGAARRPRRLVLQVHAGPAPSFDHLAVRARGDGFDCAGDGLAGEVGPRAARLELHGGTPALLAALRLCAALWLAREGGLLLHAACAEVGGRALLLAGPSGAGKTTLARRLAAQGAHIVSDEVAAVRLAGAQARLFGHPFPRRLGDGRTPAPGLPLVALGLLAQAAPGEAPSLRRLGEREAARALLPRVFLPARTPALLKAVLETAGRLAAAAPAFALALPDDARAADCVLALAGEAA